MADFSIDILKFKKDGTYEYKFDNMGNLYFNSSSNDFSQVYLSLPISNIIYNNSKIKQFYDPNFTEFTPHIKKEETADQIEFLTQQLNLIQREKEGLQSQLDAIVAQNTKLTDETGPNKLAIKQVILELRKALGQGRVESDFSDTFPYTPIIKPS